MKEKKITDFFNLGMLIQNSPYQLFRFEPDIKGPIKREETPLNIKSSVTTPTQSNSKDYSKHDKSVKQIRDPQSWGEYFCNKCNKTRVFKVVDKINHTANYIKSNGGLRLFSEGIVVHEYECAANQTHRIYLIYKLGSDYIMKIGQYPSMRDMTEPTNKDYKKIIGNEKFKEYNKAITLNSTGIGIGAFVYLRRILEDLIENAHKIALIEDQSWIEENYLKSRYKDKIKLLKEFLPQFLVDNRNIYSILSKGIHELSEEECKAHFNVMKSSIDVIVEEKLEEIRKEKQKNELMKEINQISQQLKK